MSRQFAIESLETRTLLSAAQINFADFSSINHLATNGFGSAIVSNNHKLELTNNQNWEARSAWYDTAVPIDTFRTDFTFQSDKNAIGADGLTFTIMNGPTSTLGANGHDLGYGQTSVKSVAIAFDQFNFEKFGSKFGFAQNGEKPPTNTTMGAIDLHNGHAFKVTAIYDGKTLNVTVTDATDRSKMFTASEKIDLAKVLGTSKAIVGFTAGTGANRSTQDVLSWSFAGAPAPVASAPAPTAPAFANTAHATPNPSVGTSTVLTARGVDQHDAEKKLTYTWRVMQMPAGAPVPTFSKSGNNAAKSTVAHFGKDGAYRFRVTVTNSSGLSAVSEVSVRVNQIASSVSMSPHKVDMRVGRRQTFSAAMLDQFNRPMRTQPTFVYSVESGTGKIDAATGVYTAPADVDHVILAATADGVTGTVGVTIYELVVRPTVGA